MYEYYKNLEKFYKIAKNYYLWPKSKPFYRKYFSQFETFYRQFSPFAKPRTLGLHKADNRVVVDFERGFLYNRIPKAANTTLMSALYQDYFDESLSSNEVAGRGKSFHAVPSELREEKVDEVQKLYKFTFVRNPYSRILSAYLGKIGQPESRKEYRRKTPALFRKFGDNPSFEDFCKYLAEGGAYDNKHWAPQISLLIFPPEEFDFIGKIENLSQDFEQVISNVPALEGNEIPGRVGTTTSASDKLDQYYDKEKYDLIYELYREDFQRFGYDKRKNDN